MYLNQHLSNLASTSNVLLHQPFFNASLTLSTLHLTRPGGLRFLSIPPPDVPFSDITLMPRVTPGEPRWFNVLPTEYAIR